jgi:hypothetical protein
MEDADGSKSCSCKKSSASSCKSPLLFQASRLLHCFLAAMHISCFTICDFLSTNRVATQDGGSSKYNIKHDANGNTHVSDLSIVDVTSINEVSSLLRRAAQSRSHTCSI